jgi:glycosyltransferase involved in cell wall biosynthesis
MGRRDNSLKARVKRLFLTANLRRLSAAVCTFKECCAQVGALRGIKDGLFQEVPQLLERFKVPERKSETPNHLLFLGRLEPFKGISDLLDVFEVLAPKHPEITLDFAGSGSAEEELVKRIIRSPARERIRFLGQLSGGDVHTALAGSDLLICPTRSTKEGLALVVPEAAAHGVPSLLSSVVPAKELVPEACIEFPADDTAALRDRLEEVLSSSYKFSDLRNGALKSREMLYERFKSWDSML